MADLAELMGEELERNKPTCVIQSVSWSVTKSKGEGMQGRANLAGLDKET